MLLKLFLLLRFSSVNILLGLSRLKLGPQDLVLLGLLKSSLELLLLTLNRKRKFLCDV